MKNGNDKKCFRGIVSQVVCMIVSMIAMYVCIFVMLLYPSGMREYEMNLTLALPVVMMLPGVIAYLIWFRSKAKKFASGTYTDYSSKAYGSPAAFFPTAIVQLGLGFVVTFLMLGFWMDGSVGMIPFLLISWIFLVIADVLCFWVFKPVAKEI